MNGRVGGGEEVERQSLFSHLDVTSSAGEVLEVRMEFGFGGELGLHINEHERNLGLFNDLFRKLNAG